MEIITKDPILEFPPNIVETLRKKYNLDDGRMKQSVDILESWVKKQEHFLNKNFSHRYLEVTIISCKGSVEKAKKQIDKLCTLKTILPKFFISNGLRDICDEINKVACVFVLPKLTKDNQRVFIIKINSKELTSSHFMLYCKLALALAEYLKAHDYPDGYMIVDDFRDVDLVDLVTKINLIELQQIMTILTEGFGAKLKGIYIMSQSKVVDVFVRTIKPILSAKIAGRIYVLPKLEDLYQHVEKDILPVDYGGAEKSVKELQDKWTELLSAEEHEKYLEVMKKSGTNESLRQTDKFNEQYIGMPGSFRTLTVD